MNPTLEARALLGDPPPVALRDVDELRAELQARRTDASAPLPELRGQRLIGFDLAGMDLSGVDLSGADLSGAKLNGARLLHANLSGAVLFEADLTRAELAGADLRGANLSDATLNRAGLGHADLTEANLTRADLRHASLVEADLGAVTATLADFSDARLAGASLCDGYFRQANFERAELDDADVAFACFEEAKAREASLRYLRNYTSAEWIHIDLRDVDFSGAYLLRRHILDENYLYEFRQASARHAAVYKVWSLTSDCGRSGMRWALFNAVLVLLFAGAYTQVAVDFGDDATWLSPIYFSIVTMTTLGYGDVLPTSAAAQFVTILQVIIGYVMLGGLLGIVTKKLASRAE
jgi:uncharacterized protein YjbI with pentapeptide repeats